jgi:hypothetical protein
MNINSVENILKYIYELDLQNSSFRYRGQSNYEWTLKPSIHRYKSFKRYQTVEYERNLILHKPKKPLPPLTFTNFDIEWLMLSQHYGIPTRLLDWSTDILTSLFFACKSEEQKNKDGAFFICNYNDYPVFTDYDRRISEYQKLSFVQTNIINPRMRAQSGCFMLWGHAPIDRNKSTEEYDLWEYHKDNGDDFFIKKIRIPSKKKSKILEELEKVYCISEDNLYLSNSYLFNRYEKNFENLAETARLMTLYKTDADKLTTEEEKKARSFFRVDFRNMFRNTKNLSY